MKHTWLKKHFGFCLLMVFSVILATSTAIEVNAKDARASSDTKPLPRLVDIGAKKCIPCKMMAPVIDELQKDYTESLIVEFIDVWENPGAERPYRIRTIPTQIFYDASGKELHRHIGFISKEDILNTFKNLGIEVKKNPKKGS